MPILPIVIAALAAGGILLIVIGLAGSSPVDPVQARLTQLGSMQAKNLEELELQQPFAERTLRPLANSGRAILLCISLAGCGVVRVAPTPAPERTTTDAANTAPELGQRFYTNKPYGSESQFNPLSLTINGGFDQLRVASANRQVFDLN